MAAAVSAAPIRGARAQAGMTLLEILVVLGILAIILAIGVPSMIRWQQKANVTSAVTQLSVDVARARSLSKRANQPVTLTVTGAGAYTLNGQTRALPAGVAFTATGSSLTFRPPYGTLDGASLPVTFTVQHSASSTLQRSVRVVGLFGTTVTP